MGHGFNVKPSERTISGDPIHEVVQPEIAEGRRGMPVFLNDDEVFLEGESRLGGEFFILVVAPREASSDKAHDHGAAVPNQRAQEVVSELQRRSRLHIRPFGTQGEKKDASQFEIVVDPARSHHYLESEVGPKLRGRNVKQLKALYGDHVDFFMVSCRLENRRADIFGDEFRLILDGQGHKIRDEGTKALRNINTRTFDLVQTSAEGAVEVMHRGGFAIFDRQDPEGTPDHLYGVNLSDLHLAQRTDKFEEALIVKYKTDTYLKFNNPNANFDAIVAWINAEYSQGNVDWAMLMGDNVDFDGVNYQASGRLKESNHYHVAKALNRLLPPAFVGLGNHDVLRYDYPAAVSSGNLNLTFEETMALEAERYPYGELASLLKFGYDAVQATINTENAKLAHFDNINPFEDFIIDFGRGDPKDPQSRSARLVYADMGGADYSHLRPDDPIYKEAQFWPWGWDWKHFQTIGELIGKASPDVRGPTPEQNAWLARQFNVPDTHVHVFMHPPLLSSAKDESGFETKGPIRPVQPAGEFEDLTFNTMAHYGDFFASIADSPSVRTVWGGHSHRDLGSGDYAFWKDLQNGLQIYRGDTRRLLNQMDPYDRKLTRDFYSPWEGCASSVAALFGDQRRQIRDLTYTFQIGAAGVSRRVLSRVTLNPDGLFSGEERFYVNKALIKDSKNADLYHVRSAVEKAPKPHERVVAEWADVQRERPEARLDWNTAVKSVRARMSTADDSFVRHPDSYGHAYPRYREDLTHAYRSADKWYQQFEARVLSDAWPTLHDGQPGYSGSSFSFAASYYFSQHQMNELVRDMLFQGVEVGYGYTQNVGHRTWAAAVIPPVINWNMADNLTLKGLELRFGPELEIPDLGKPYLRLHSDLTWFELQYLTHGNVLHSDESPIGGRLGFGVLHRNLFMGPSSEMWFLSSGLYWK